MTDFLFSYGTLQLEKVQLESFGRKLQGTKEILKGFTVAQVQIIDPIVLEKSQQEFHPIAVPSANSSDCIAGTLYEITAQEIQQADEYEVDDYKRIKVTFDSGKSGWIYVKA